MLTAGLLLIGLSVLSVHGFETILDAIYIDYGDDYTTDSPSLNVELSDWLFDLLDESNVCDPNPCFSGGSCQSKSETNFTCSCPEPYMGKRCQKVRNVCENIRCGHGDCVVNLKKPPFYECKCKPPYQGPDCKTLPTSPCEPNPCQNGASCICGNRRFRCACTNGYTGKFCETAPTDCYEGNGETYRGMVSTTDDGLDCLDWHSNIILMNGEDPFTMYSDFTGLEFNNHCRNPDGDERPWCFFKNKKGRLSWEYCKVKKCSAPVPPTPVQPDPAGPAQFSQCGLTPFPTRTSRIFGGSKAFPGSLPWQASVQVRPKGFTNEFVHFCGGILLSSCWVLTAAHCIDSLYEYQVVLGGVNIHRDEDMDQTIPVVETIIHEDYRDAASALFNDIALLKLKVTDSPYCAKETRFVKAACLPDEPFPPGKECVISGWGATETKSHSSQLLKARVLLISKERCNGPHVYSNRLDGSMMCAGTLQGGIDSCQGDSGGPLVCEQNDISYIAGVVSWGDGCGEKNKPGVYANVHTFIDWIKSKIN
ncbi:hyaluronan-binding protein 2-like isoform X2 [Scomber japonicus]|uniref:hyaluronan-binding protein 2-like isoform X2 n=1 Tax=Scomber japonicus TaxID=13676 RepID=UPI002305501D|nr:hyaluronan-binding protein 2-like isoform X2 [Scomber japonicus]